MAALSTTLTGGRLEVGMESAVGEGDPAIFPAEPVPVVGVRFP